MYTKYIKVKTWKIHNTSTYKLSFERDGEMLDNIQTEWYPTYPTHTHTIIIQEHTWHCSQFLLSTSTSCTIHNTSHYLAQISNGWWQFISIHNIKECTLQSHCGLSIHLSLSLRLCVLGPAYILLMTASSPWMIWKVLDWGWNLSTTLHKPLSIV